MEQTLGMRIGALRRAKGMTQDELAEKFGVSPQAVSKWENDISCPDIMILPQLAKILETTVDALLGGEEEYRPTVTYLPPEQRKRFDDMMFIIQAESEQDQIRVRVNLPMPLVKFVLASGGSIEGLTGGAVKDTCIDIEQVIKLVEKGVLGQLVEVDVEDYHVTITVE